MYSREISNNNNDINHLSPAAAENDSPLANPLSDPALLPDEPIDIIIKNKYRINPAFYTRKAPITLLYDLLSQTTQYAQLFNDLKTGLQTYAAENLNKVGDKYHYTTEAVSENEPQKKTAAERAEAVNLLMDMIDHTSLDQLYRYVMTPKFQSLIGAHHYIRAPWRTHLYSVIHKFTAGYENFQSRTTDDHLLYALMHDTVRQNITDHQLGQLLLHFSVPLIADIIVNLYHREDFSFTCDNGTLIHYSLLDRILADDKEAFQQINNARSSKKASLILPFDAISPGKNINIENLSKYELYQYEGPTISAVENWLLRNYKSLLVNRISDWFENESQPQLNLSTPYHFYLVSAARYMLFDPNNTSDANYFRFKDFKKDIRELINSYQPHHSENEKPVIFTGIINIDSTHYLSYFIYKNLQGKVQVITVDPSPLVQVDRNEDNKLKTKAKLVRIFQDIFPGCQYEEANVSQMLRERDCGPNAATTLKDAFDTCLSYTFNKTALIQFINDKMQFDASQLSVQGKPIGINPYDDTYLYSSQLERDSLASRAEWAERLASVTEVFPLTIRNNTPESLPYSIKDIYLISEQIKEV